MTTPQSPREQGRWRSARLAAALATLAALLGAARGGVPVHALAIASTDVALARASAAAVRGVVVGSTARRDPDVDVIYTHVLIAVSRAWGFPAPPAQVELKLLGGAVEGQTLVVGEQAQFVVGEEVIALLDVRPRDGTLSVTGLARGKWTVLGADRDGTTAVRRRDESALDAADPVAVESLAALAGSIVHLPARDYASHEPAASDLASSAATNAVVARWHEADWGQAIAVDSAFGGHPLFPGGGVYQLLRALATWSDASPLQLAPGSERTPRCFGNSESADGRISVSYDDPCGEIADTSPVLAIGGAVYSSSDVRDVRGAAYWKITKGMVVLDNVLAKYAAMSTGCYEELLTHELGHAIGLDHVAITPAVMAPTLAPSCVNRTESQPLQAPDLAALAAPYPWPTTQPGPPSTPGGLAAEVDGHRVTIRWVAGAGAPATAFHVAAGSLPGASDYGALALTGTSVVVPDVATGVYYLRVLALNAHGASVPAPDIAVVVGDGLPGKPTSLVAAGGPGGTVRIFWRAGPGPAPNSYVLLAGDAPGGIDTRLPLGAPALVADHVPSGTYYVRVAATTAAGMGPVSAAITVVVP